MKHVIFEGVDGGGKTTLIKGYNWRSGHRTVTSDRWLPSYLVYDPVDRREHRETLRGVAAVFEITFLVLVEAPVHLIVSRLLARDPNQRAVGRQIKEWGRSALETKVLWDIRRYRRVALSVADYNLIPLVLDSTDYPDEAVDQLVRAVEDPSCLPLSRLWELTYENLDSSLRGDPR
jgi:thymidylate kinase